MRCFGCNASIGLASGERVGFRDACDQCNADLHVCRNCRHHDPTAYNECREPSAERVSSSERANRCDYFEFEFEPGQAEGGSGAAHEQTLSDLESLFKK